MQPHYCNGVILKLGAKAATDKVKNNDHFGVAIKLYLQKQT